MRDRESQATCSRPFKTKDVPEREARNPSTGATIQVAASKKVTFQPAKAMKDKLNA
jgi:DNA-binding protein HU-beta